jgi:hypothetical protein
LKGASVSHYHPLVQIQCERTRYGQSAWSRDFACDRRRALIAFREFADLIARGNGPTRSAFLSGVFALVGCHGGHVSAGILWLLTMMAQVFQGLPRGHKASFAVLRAVLARISHRLS